MEISYVKEFINSVQEESLLNSINTIYRFRRECKKDFDRGIVKVADKIINNPEQEITVSTLSKDIFISEYHLIRKFKKYIGMTPHQFHIQNRIRKSQRLLTDEKNIIDVSAEMGFYDQSHFNKSFKKIMGISPSEYIRSKKEI